MQKPEDPNTATPTGEPSAPPKRESRARKIGRLLLFCVGVSAIGAGVALHSVYADVLDKGLGVGNELGKLGDSGAVRPVRINGQQINVVSTIEDRTFETVLDQVEVACKQRSAGLRDIVDSLP